MNYKPLSSALVLLLFSLWLSAQNFDRYQPLKAEGPIPQEFLKAASKKYQEDISKRIGKDEKRKARKQKEKFYLQTNFVIDKVLLSGKVLFNDPVTDYINELADQVLKDEPELRNRLKFYTIQSPAVNAFATSRGIIFVNLGLIAQAENEAQLAYILCHEIEHYKNKHSINKYIESKRITEERGGYDHLTSEEKVIAQSNYSKKIETEADVKGLDLYSKTDYKLDEIFGAFNVLQYSYLPIDDIQFPKDFLNTEHLKIPDKYFLEKTAPIKAGEKYDDSKSSHPSVPDRKKRIAEELINYNPEGRSIYLVSKERFFTTREIARFELCRLYLQQRDYGDALYTAFVLQQDHPESKFLKQVVVQALYGLTKYANENKYYRLDIDYDEVEGESQQVYHLLEELPEKGLNVIASLHAWKLRQTYPNDPFIEDIANDLIKELVFEHEMTLKDFYNVPADTIKKRLKKLISPEDSTYKELSKYEKIKAKEKRAALEGSNKFYKFAFVDLLKDTAFKNRFRLYVDEKNEQEQAAMNKFLEDEDETTDKKGYALGFDEVTVVEPFYAKVDQRKDIPVKYIATEEAHQNFKDKIKENAQKVGLKTKIIDNKFLEADQVEKFNDIALLKQWVDERLEHKDVDMLCSLTPNTRKLANKYNNPYFCWLGSVGVREDMSFKWGFCILTTIYFPLLPYGIYRFLKPEHDTYYFSFLFDITNGDLLMKETKSIDLRDRNDVLNAHLYYTMLQMKYERK